MFPRSILLRRPPNGDGTHNRRVFTICSQGVDFLDEHGFYTQKGYEMRRHQALTGAMEDYLEMICRQARAEGYVRINFLAGKLNVRPSSASKMVYQLRDLGLVAFEKYGLIQPTEKGWEVGGYLLYRHDVLHRFFCMINQSEDELEQVEQVEHFLNEKTVRNLEQWMDTHAAG